MSDGQRLGALRVSGELMRDHLFRATTPGVWIRTESGIPHDAEFVRCYEDMERNEFVFIYRHPSFPLVRPGERTPNLDAPQLSQLHLTLPLQPDTPEFLAGLIAQQVERGPPAGPDAPAVVVRCPPSERTLTLSGPPGAVVCGCGTPHTGGA